MFINMFVAVNNYNTSFCEHNHKYQAKIPGRRAAKRHKTFTKSIANNVVDTNVVNLFNHLVQQHDHSKPLDEKTSMECDDDNDRFVASNKYATSCIMSMSMENNNVHVEWNTRSNFDMHLPDDLQQFLVQEYNLDTVPDKTLTIYTQYKRNGVLYRCHPNYRGDGPWYDWVMMSYEDENDPGVVLNGPARLIAIVVDSTDPDHKYQPITQWGGDETNKNSVLFMEYEFDFDNVDDQVDTFTVHDICLLYTSDAADE